MTAAAPDPDAPGLPDRIGSYRVLEVLGEGGMGTVYLAEQHEPVHRKVALKVVKVGMDTRAVLARFQTERQALERMEHEHIARVLDAGVGPDGRPFFAMEYVAGVPFTDYCERHALPLRARLELFIRVCGGVQHAHQKGIIHRDLKPANILVAEQDGQAVPKIIDFGLARAMDRNRSLTQVTANDEILGTPAWMSPEQCDLREHDIDARTDIWALGVVLYELLVGDLPFPRDEAAKAGLAQLRRWICEVEPARPSVRLAGAAGRGNERERSAWLRALRGDLDWIVMRALEKDPARRYQTVLALADDVNRNLRSEPVEARPPTLGYRVARFVRKHRLPVAAALVAVGSLLVGAAVCFWLLLETHAARQAAELASAASRTQLALAQMAAIDRAAYWTAQSFTSARAPTLDEVAKMRIDGQPVLTGIALPALDPWGHEYRLQATSPAGTWLVRSAGRDGHFDTTDDLQVHDRMFASGMQARWRALFTERAERLLDVVQESAVFKEAAALSLSLTTAEDPWGQPMEPHLLGDQWVVRSLGADRAPGTADDLQVARAVEPVFVAPAAVRAQVGRSPRVWTQLPVLQASLAQLTASLRPLLGSRAGALEQLRFDVSADRLVLVGPPDLVAFVIDNLHGLTGAGG
ncbi:MAG: serine/threonine protein kinase [Planctomycetes bacterium]|nr:serine/threonine protein kinase [Planctomycetota bacterium]